MAADVLSERALGRATLARQMLLERSTLDLHAAVEHLVGLQAQNPFDPYLALWSRLADFDPIGLGEAIEQRSLVRIVVMRGTIHLLTADDALFLRPLTQPVLDAEIARHQEFAPSLVGVDLGPVLHFAQERLAETPMSGTRLRAALAAEFPALHAGALAYACRCRLPLVQVPPRGVWGKTLQVTSTPLDAWVGRPLGARPSVDEMVMRYLAAFGPATVADVSSWSRLPGFREVLERLRPRLQTFTDPRGRELFDLDDAPRPEPDVPAPVRLLPQYDNLLLSHADRSRFITPELVVSSASAPARGSVLVDGRVLAVWHHVIDKRSGTVAVVVEHRPLSNAEAEATAAEADRAARFWHPWADGIDVRLVAT